MITFLYSDGLLHIDVMLYFAPSPLYWHCCRPTLSSLLAPWRPEPVVRERCVGRSFILVYLIVFIAFFYVEKAPSTT